MPESLMYERKLAVRLAVLAISTALASVAASIFATRIINKPIIYSLAVLSMLAALASVVVSELLRRRKAAYEVAKGAEEERRLVAIPIVATSIPIIWTVLANLAAIGAISAPSLLNKSRIAGNASSAVGALRTFNTSLLKYSATYADGRGYPLTLDALGPPRDGISGSCRNANLIDSVLASGKKSGYIFKYEPGPLSPTLINGCPAISKSYKLTAFPAEFNTTGTASYYTDESEMIRATNENRPALVSDPPLR